MDKMDSEVHKTAHIVPLYRCLIQFYLSVLYSGDTGQGVRDWIKQVLKQDLSFQHIKVIYPTAPARYCILSYLQ